MEEKIKVYVDSNEKNFITDCYLADNTKIICEFYHEESEIEYSNCKLLNLQEYDKQKDQRIAELEQELAELKERMQEEINRREIYFISFLNNQVCKGYVIGYDEENKFVIICGEDMISANEIFTYEHEAQEKLKEIQGNE